MWSTSEIVFGRMRQKEIRGLGVESFEGSSRAVAGSGPRDAKNSAEAWRQDPAVIGKTQMSSSRCISLPGFEYILSSYLHSKMSQAFLYIVTVPA